jgi:hypothetical protein
MPINKIIDEKIIAKHNLEPKRNYLGASMIGSDCVRKVQLQYFSNAQNNISDSLDKIGKPDPLSIEKIGNPPDFSLDKIGNTLNPLEKKEKSPVFPLEKMRCDTHFSAKTLRTFDIGHYLEDLIAYWMVLAGFDLRTRNEKNEQFGFSIADGRIGGHIDGIIFDFPSELKQAEPLAERINGSRPQALASAAELSRPGSAWLWECKTMNNKSWNDTQKRGVFVSKSIYYVQVQLYMAYMDLTENPCLFTALNKDSSELYHEFIPFDAEAAQRYSDRAALIIKATENGELLPGISTDPSFYQCKMCDFRKECFRELF